MANTYSQLYVHLVFAVKRRQNFIDNSWKNELYKYISGIVSAKNQKLMIINGMPNHVHILLGIQPDCHLSDLVRDIKANSSKWINESKFLTARFEWQRGFGAFSLGHSQLPRIINYIKNQEAHHKSKTLKKEYIEFLNAYAIDFNEEYLFSEF